MKSEGMHHRVFYRDRGLFGTLHAIDVVVADPHTAKGEADLKLIDEMEDEDDQEWDWVATVKIEHCGTCGRLRELNLVHKCPGG
jgi:hypothetical protein